MINQPHALGDDDPRVDEVLADFMDAKGSGHVTSWSAYKNEHPELAAEPHIIGLIEDYFENSAKVQSKIKGLVVDLRTCWQCLSPLGVTLDQTLCDTCRDSVLQHGLFPLPYPTDTRLGDFELKEVVGRGGFGTVYRAWDLMTKRTVAVKILHAHRAASPRDHERFMREAQVTAQLDHANIVRIFRVVPADKEAPYLVCEWVAGPTLTTEADRQRFTPREAAELIAAVADGLAASHQKRVIHRDIKPDNILMATRTLPKLTDFGLAAWEHHDRSLTNTGELVGTPAFMSPEQTLGLPDSVDYRTDIYSLGVVLYYLLTGERPFVGKDVAVLQQIQTTEPRAPRTLNNEIDIDLETVCLHCLHKERALRYPTAADLAADLRRYLAHQPVVARPLPWWQRWGWWMRRNPPLATAFGLVAALLLATVTVSVAWAWHAGRYADELQQALETSQLVTAESQLDRGLAVAEQGDIAWGMHHMLNALANAPTTATDLRYTIRTNLHHWQQALVRLTACWPMPPGRVLAFDADGHGVWLVADDYKTLQHYDLRRGTVDATRASPVGMVNAVTLSPDGTTLAVAGSNGLCEWPVADGAAPQILHEKEHISSVSYTPKQSQLLYSLSVHVGGGRVQGAVKSWHPTAPQELAGLQGGDVFHTLAATADGRTLYMVGGRGQQVRRWDRAKGQLAESLWRHPMPIAVIALSPDERWLLTGADRQARLWDVASGELVMTFHHRQAVTAVGFTNAGRHLMTASINDAVRVWEMPNDAAARLTFPERVRSVSTSPDGTMFATGTDDGIVRLWQHEAGRLVATKHHLPLNGPIRSTAFHPSNKYLVALGWDAKGAHLWNIMTNDRVTLPHLGGVRQALFCPDGSSMATVGYDGKVQLWSVTNGKPLVDGPLPGSVSWQAAAYRADSQMLVTADTAGQLQRWAAPTATLIGLPLTHGPRVTELVFHPTQTHVLASADAEGGVRFWDTRTGEALWQPLQHGGPLANIAFRGEDTLYTAGKDGLIRRWNIGTGQAHDRTWHHGTNIRTLLVNPSSRWGLTVSDFSTTRLWSLHDGRAIGPATRHPPSALTATLSPNERWVLTGGEDRTACLQAAPQEIEGDVASLRQWLEVHSGLTMDRHHDPQPLAPTAWRQRQEQWHNSNAPPR